MKDSKKSYKFRKTSIILFLLLAAIFIGIIYDAAYNFRAFTIQIKLTVSIILLAALIASLLPRFRVAKLSFSLPIALGMLLLISISGVFSLYYDNYVYSNWETLRREEMKKLTTEVVDQFSNNIMNMIERATRSLSEDKQLLDLLAQGVNVSTKQEIFDVIRVRLRNHNIPEEDFGFSLLSPEGKIIAWYGNTKPFSSNEFETVKTSKESTFIYKGIINTWLNTLQSLQDTEGTILGYAVGQFLLESYYGMEQEASINRSKVLPQILIQEDRVSIDFYDFREERGDLKSLFTRYGDFVWSRSRREGESLFFPLYNFNEDILGVITVVSLDRESYVNRQGNKLQFFAALLILIVAIGMAILQSKSYLKRIKKDNKDSFVRWLVKSIGSFLVIIFLLWFIRWLFILLNFPINLKNLSVFEPMLFFQRSYLAMFRSPADFLLTSLFIFIGAFLFSLFIYCIGQKIKHLDLKTIEVRNKGVIRALKLFVSFLLALAISSLLLQFNQFLNQLAFHSGIKLAIFTLEPPHLPRICLEIGLHFLALSILAAIFSAFYVFRLVNVRKNKQRSAILYLFYFIITIILILLLFKEFNVLFIVSSTLLLFIISILTINFTKIKNWFIRSSLLAQIASVFLFSLSAILLYYPSISIYLENVKSNFVENVIIPQIDAQREDGNALINSSFSIIEQSKKLKDELKATESEDTGIAYSFWREIGFAFMDFNSSLTVLDSQGNVLDSFSFYFPPHETEKLEDLEQYIEPDINLKWLHYGSREVEVIQGKKTIVDNGEIIGAVIASIAIGYDNLSFIHSKDPYYEIFRPRSPNNPERILFNDRLFLIAYEWDGRIRFNSSDKIFSIDDAIIAELNENISPMWSRISIGGDNYQIVFFSSLDSLLAIGFPRNSLRDYLFSIASLIAISGLALLALAIIVFIFKIEKSSFRLSGFNLWKGIVRSYYRKLLALFILISIIPSIFLSLSIRNYLSERLFRQIREEGIATAEFAKRAMEDYLFTQEQNVDKPEELIDDNLALLISSWANKDIHIFYDDFLIATNKRELFSAGLISPRIYDEIYYQLALARQPYVSSQHQLRNFSYLVISVPIELQSLQKPTILSTPLMLEQRQLEIEIAEINDTIFIATVILIIFCSVLSYSIARRVSDPIKKLTQSTYQISKGNFDLTVTTESKDEMKDLVESFNLMAQNIKQKQIALREGKEYIEKILLNAPAGVLSLDDKGIITTINPAAISLLSLKQKTLMGKSLHLVIAHTSGLKELKRFLAKSLSKPQKQLNQEIQIESRGQKINLRVKFIPLQEYGAGISGSIILLEDITEVIKSNRLTTWAEMARIIAHEIKNPLTPIQLSAEHLQQVIKDQPPGFIEISDACIEGILKQVMLLRQLSTQFSNYAKLPQLKLSKLDIEKLISQVIGSYASLRRDKYEVIISIADTLPSIQGDRELLRRALTNIIENSLEAMPKGGKLTINAKSGLRQRQQGIKIEITDTGSGIDKETLKRLFEPYFSTKDSGVGLGLAITKKTMEEHKGEIWVKSTLGKGTKIFVWLPVEKED